MAQLNPNFEIDYNDINSYEQIQLINDAQLARENLLMHRAYREPSDDEVIRQNYSSYTFIDFRPRIFATKCLNSEIPNSRNSSSSRSLFNQSTTNVSRDEQANGSNNSCDNGATGELFNSKSVNKSIKPSYELEKFSSIFERINIWLKLNKEWQAVSVETLFYDSASQFNHLRSSTFTNHLPKNTRGIRLHLSPFKSRFSGPQKIGCINVVPRRLSTRKIGKPISPHQEGSVSVELNGCKTNLDDCASNYENLDQILARLNELLLSRPIEGRILSVETITLPIINGRVDYECNYITDSRLNLLEQFTNCSADPQPPAGYRGDMRGHCLVDILRVYYEFGPMVCGLVNLIDYVPRFYSPTELIHDHYNGRYSMANNEDEDDDDGKSDQILVKNEMGDQFEDCKLADSDFSLGLNLDLSLIDNRKCFATESLTRLIRRSLAWFEDESRRVLDGSPASPNAAIDFTTTNGISIHDNYISSHMNLDNDDNNHLKLRLCNLQVHHKTLLKGELYSITPSNILDVIQTRTMIHRSKASLISSYQKLNSLRKSSLGTELSQPYDVKFVRLAYVLPIYDRLTHTVFPLCTQVQSCKRDPFSVDFDETNSDVDQDEDEEEDGYGDDEENDSDDEDENENENGSFWNEKNSTSLSVEVNGQDAPTDGPAGSRDVFCKKDQSIGQTSVEIGGIKKWALNIMEETNMRHLQDEMAHQAGLADTDKLNDSPIGQLTYRLFAPCQLVNSSSCFAINPVNSSSSLARRGSVDLNGSGLSSDSAHPCAMFPSGPSPSCNGAQLLDTSIVDEIIAENSVDFADENSILQQSTGFNAECIPIIANLNGTPDKISNATSSNNSNPNSLPKEMSSSLKSFGAFIPNVFSTTSSDSAANLPSSSSCVATSRLQAPIQALGLAANSVINPDNNQQQQQQSANSRFTTNEFESVEAIRKRMEIYVTTNSMKVLAGETLIVNLSSNLSCLSNAIEQTVVRSSFARIRASSWVSVYMLYAAVDEPLIPSQLLAQQKLRELTLINEEESCQENKEKNDNQQAKLKSDAPNKLANTTSEEVLIFQDADQACCQNILQTDKCISNNDQEQSHNESTCVNLNQEEDESNLTKSHYNCAYERIVALPTNPEDHMNHVDPGQYLEEQLESELLNVNQKQAEISSVLQDNKASISDMTRQDCSNSQWRSDKSIKSKSSSISSSKRSKKLRKNKRHDEAQCSII